MNDKSILYSGNLNLKCKQGFPLWQWLSLIYFVCPEPLIRMNHAVLSTATRFGIFVFEETFPKATPVLVTPKIEQRGI